MTLFAAILFGGFMWFITSAIEELKVKKHVEKKERPLKTAAKRNPKKKKSFFEKYCNEQKNDSRKALAHYILIHDKNAREERKQKD